MSERNLEDTWGSWPKCVVCHKPVTGYLQVGKGMLVIEGQTGRSFPYCSLLCYRKFVLHDCLVSGMVLEDAGREVDNLVSGARWIDIKAMKEVNDAYQA